MLSKLETQKTITVLALACLVAYVIFEVRWLLYAAIALCLGNAAESRITAALAAYWMRLAAVLGRINTKIILAVMFFLILTPIAVIYRLFNRQKVEHFRTNRRSSYFDDVQKTFGREDFEKLW